MKKSVKISLISICALTFALTVLYALIGVGPTFVIFLNLALFLFVASLISVKSTRGQKVFKRVVALSLTAVIFIAGLITSVFGITYGGKQTADYTRRIEIWGEVIPYNIGGSKLEKMNISFLSRPLGANLNFSKTLNKDYYVDAERIMDTMTYATTIKAGVENATFTDVPYLIPYAVEESDSAVIVVCGGGFVNKSINFGAHEGIEVAKRLNQNGISAFVLWYRSNPYEYPVPQADFMRAVKYLRFNASTFGFNPDNISAVGFSAGAFVVASYINLLDELYPLDYKKDAIDAVSGDINTAGLVYPVLTYEYNVPMLFCSFSAEKVKDEEQRKELLDKTDLSKHVNSLSVNQFVSYGTNDYFVNFNGAKKYIAAASKKGVNLKVEEVKGQKHAFSKALCMSEFIEFLLENEK